MPCRGQFTIYLLLLVTLAPSIQGQVPMDTLALAARARFLSHDLLEGRDTGSRGAALAAAYIESQCRGLGLLPVGGSYEQAVPLEEALVDASTRLTVTHSGQTALFRYPSDVTPNLGTKDALHGFEGPAVYLGLAEGVTRASLAGMDLRGAVAVVGGARIDVDAAALLREQGAVGLIQLVPDPRTYDLYRRGRGDARLYHAVDSVASSFLPGLPVVLAGPQVTRALLVGSHVAAGEIESPGSLNREVQFTVVARRRPVEAANIACLLPGREPQTADTVIVFAAHYDHLGVGVPDSARDSVYNGFADNAAGVAMVLGIAQSFARTGGTRHSMLFLFPVGEERGFLGSDYYTANPLWPLERTLAVITVDAGAPAAPPVTWELAGVDSSGLGAVAISVAAARGWDVKTSHARPNSDYFPFTRRGVAGMLIIPGQGPYEGLSADSSDALRHRWRYYHDPQDEWTEGFPQAGLVRYASYAYLIAEALDAGFEP